MSAARVSGSASSVTLQTSGAPLGSRDWFEQQVQAFEALARGPRSSMERFLGSLPGEAPHHVIRELMLELIAVELELRWRNTSARGKPGARAKLEHYLKRFPKLGDIDEIPLWLIAEEYRVRRRWGDVPQTAEYLARFPRHGLELEKWLAAADDDLHSEGAAPRQSTRRVAEFPAEPIDPQAPLFHGDYFLRRFIGAGGMCKVYTGVQRSLGKPVAIKVLKKSLLADRRAVERFLREARIAAGLRHPAIVSVHGLGRFPDGGYFMAMDLIEGEDLQRKSQRGVLPTEAASFTAQAAQAVAFCHGAGVIHADLKPSNLIVDSHGVVHLTDFGLARRMDEKPEDPAEALAGTAAYMAPEQIDGHWGQITTAIDIYALGAVLYTLLAGRPPYMGVTRDELLSQIAAPGVRPDPLNVHDPIRRQLADVALRCLAKQRAERPSNAGEVAETLQQQVTFSCLN